MESEVIDNTDQGRYEIHVDGALAGVAQYRRQSGVVTFIHTEIDPAYAGQGLGNVLARSALDRVRGDGERIVPQCPFIAAYLRRHSEYADLVIPEH